MNRIIIKPEEVALGVCDVSLTDDRAEHLRRILKVLPGHSVRVGLLDGPLGLAEVVRVDEESVQLHCRWEDSVPSVPRVDLLLAAPRPKVLKRLWPQLAALGVGSVCITNAEKVERNYFDTHVLDTAFIRAQLIEGLQQCGDTHLPRVTVHRRLKVLLEDELNMEMDTRLRLIAHPIGGARMRGIIQAGNPDRILLAVGPEGGWTEYELALFARHGFTAVSSGARILRSDTACIALLAVLHEELGCSP